MIKTSMSAHAATKADLVQMDVPVGHRRVILAHVRGSGKRQQAAGATVVPVSRGAVVVPPSRSPRNALPPASAHPATVQQVQGRVVAVNGRQTGVMML